MPGGDRTGPAGYMNPVGGFGYGGWGRGFQGGGRGRRNWFYATGLPGWSRTAQGMPARGGAVNPYAYDGAPFAPTRIADQELDGLKGQSEYLEDALDGIKKRIEELESQKSSKD